MFKSMKPLVLIAVLCLFPMGVYHAQSVSGTLVQSSYYQSPLLQPHWQEEELPLPDSLGLHHPFQSFHILGDAILDAFRVGQPRYALFDYRYRDKDMDFGTQLNFVAGYDQRVEDGKAFGFIWKGIKLRAKVNERINANAWWWNGAFTGDKEAAKEHSLLIDGFFTEAPTQMRVDNLNADLGYRSTHFDAIVGRGRPDFGNNLTGSIILSQRVNDYGYFLTQGRFGALGFRMMHASLMADSTRSQNRLATDDFPDKYLALHEITWQITPRIKAFGGEGVVYGDRGWDINYLLPHTFWRVVEHNQWDRDNVVLWGGLEAEPHQNLDLWFTGLFDELSYGKLFSNWWGNKWAIQSGGRLALPSLATGCGIPALSAEIVVVRPWTYTHYQNQTMYSHDGRPLGYPQGANLVSGTLELEYPVREMLMLVGHTSWMRQGSEGSDWRTNYSDHFPPNIINTAETRWFAGDKSDTFQIGSLLKIKLAHNQLYVGQRSSHKDKWQHSFFGGWMFQY